VSPLITQKNTTPALYVSGLDIYVTFTPEAARRLPDELRRQLLCKPNKVGAWVMSLKGLATLRWKND